MPFQDAAPEPITADAFARLMVPFAIARGARVAVAVSGGADSLALVLLMEEWARAHGVTVRALTVDHRLRAQSSQEARTVGAWLSARGIEHHILTWTAGPEARTGLQAKARDARYRLMAAWCRAHDAGQVFVAHHQGDQAETFVMRLKRMSTLYGLKAMAPVRFVPGDGAAVALCRPLLTVTKGQLQATLTARGQAWLDDPSNANPAFERVRTRALIQALTHEGVTPARLAGAAAAAGRLADIVDRAAEAFEAAAVTPHGGDGLKIDAAAYAALPCALRERVASRLLARTTSQGYGLRYGPSPLKVARLARWMGGDGADGAARTLGGWIVRRGKNALIFVREAPRRPAVASVRPAGFFAIQPLPRDGKRLTSQALAGAGP